ncbi:hypothetical protein RhiirA1_402504 [Rhizophagus irregularis]|uniref:Uncharacterized protein n=1 Tax=Rhizophagus irregularis TaxID=588596 RepID=A0A2N0QY01_9GLOM|nr:hypothetical protein RhiirA1_402504 [Rhizophagus irregularis]
MCESVLYKCEQLPLNEAFEFIDDQLDQDEFNKYNANSNDNQIDMSNQNKEKIENIEDYYDFRQIYLKALISSVLRKSIKEVCFTFKWVLFYMFLNIFKWVIVGTSLGFNHIQPLNIYEIINVISKNLINDLL